MRHFIANNAISLADGTFIEANETFATSKIGAESAERLLQVGSIRETEAAPEVSVEDVPVETIIVPPAAEAEAAPEVKSEKAEPSKAAESKASKAKKK